MKNTNMSLADLLKAGDKQCKGFKSGNRVPGDVMISALKDDGLVGISIRRSPRNYSFRGKNYVLPIFVEDLNRVYILISSEQKGFKLTSGKATIGNTQVTNRPLYNALKNGNQRRTYEWKWDPDCSRPYVLLEGE